ALRPGPASARSAATRQSPCRRERAPAPDSRGICRRRSASARAHRHRRQDGRLLPAVRRGTARSQKPVSGGQQLRSLGRHPWPWVRWIARKPLATASCPAPATILPARSNGAFPARAMVGCFAVFKPAPILANTGSRPPCFRRPPLLANVALLPCQDWLAP